METQSVNGDLFTGNVFEVTQYNHAHHGHKQIKLKFKMLNQILQSFRLHHL